MVCFHIATFPLFVPPAKIADKKDVQSTLCKQALVCDKEPSVERIPMVLQLKINTFITWTAANADSSNDHLTVS